MKLTDEEQLKFAAYCRHMAEMEKLALEARAKLPNIAKPLLDEMNKPVKALIGAYTLVAMDLEKWIDAEEWSAAGE